MSVLSYSLRAKVSWQVYETREKNAFQLVYIIIIIFLKLIKQNRWLQSYILLLL